MPAAADTAVVTAFGAVGDGETLATAPIQRAIDAVAAAGGGRVLVPPGRFRIGTIFLRSDVTLELAARAALVASDRREDYPAIPYDAGYQRSSHHLVVIRDCARAVLCGMGTIDGSAPAFCEPVEDPDAWIRAKPWRPDAMVTVLSSRDVQVRDLLLTNPPNWNCDIFHSDRVLVHGIRIINDGRWPNNDGIDISGSHDVTISDCQIDTGDDGIVINTRTRDVRRVLVTNCMIRSECAALKVGWEFTRHDIREVVFSNCVLAGCNRGLAAYSCNGAVIEDVAVSNIVHDSNCPVMFSRPIHLDLRRGRDTGTFGAIRRLQVSNFLSRTQGRVLMTCEDGGFLEDITIRDLSLAYPYIEDPEPHAEENTSSQFSNANRAARRARAAIVAENIRRLHIAGLRTAWPSGPVPEEWRIRAKRENGGRRIFRPDYDTPHAAPFALMWARDVDGIVEAPFATASAEGVEPWRFERCRLRTQGA